ncbi:uncharacterized protein LOC121769454 isoform X2 [Salvia splendens]|uniref:uncharacterized protein LOC121769454 isoform X2 n=1 Tax=Salvia splendens TaxID=180675 RepID=UPI001C25D12E|nr:uncharacterized protein LOC121769454 isoform X2 [Salvia splendens]
MVSITSRIDPWKVQEVRTILLSYETRLEGDKQSSVNLEGSQPSINLVHQAQHKKDVPPQQGREGYHTSGRGDSSRGGYRSGRGGRGRVSGGKLVCQVCQKPGHGAERCWHRFEHNFAPQPQQNRISHYPQSSPSAHLAHIRQPPHHQMAPSIANTSEYGYDGANAVWYPDSGATNHVSNDLGNLNISSEYHGVQGNRAQGNP